MIEKTVNYSNVVDKIHRSIEENSSLNSIPFDLLYDYLKEGSLETAVLMIPLLNREQRIAFWDLDLWRKDEINTKTFEYWPQVYGSIKDEDLRFEFVTSDAFSLYIKGRFNIWNFDVEEPLYPDHDHFFLTEDHLLLFEFDPDYPYPHEVQDLIKVLYARLGVEKSYAFLFKIVADSYLMRTEEEYLAKKLRLEEYGFIDYFDALEILHIFRNREELDRFIDGKRPSIIKVDTMNDEQILRVIEDREGSEILLEFKKIHDGERLDYLKFNLLKLFNAYFILEKESGKFAKNLRRRSEKILPFLDLAISYIRTQNINTSPLLLRFDLMDLFRIGKTLFKIEQVKIDPLEFSKNFWGTYWENFKELSMKENPMIVEGRTISSYSDYCLWSRRRQCLEGSFPYILKFETMFNKLCKDDLIENVFYWNYSLEDIDFETLLLSSFINTVLCSMENKEREQKLGILIKDFKKVFIFLTRDNNLDVQIDLFIERYGFAKIFFFKDYLLQLWKDHLEGYDILTLEDKDFKYIGGPLLFTP